MTGKYGPAWRGDLRTGRCSSQAARFQGCQSQGIDGRRHGSGRAEDARQVAQEAQSEAQMIAALPFGVSLV